MCTVSTRVHMMEDLLGELLSALVCKYLRRACRSAMSSATLSTLAVAVNQRC